MQELEKAEREGASKAAIAAIYAQLQSVSGGRGGRAALKEERRGRRGAALPRALLTRRPCRRLFSLADDVNVVAGHVLACFCVRAACALASGRRASVRRRRGGYPFPSDVVPPHPRPAQERKFPVVPSFASLLGTPAGIMLGTPATARLLFPMDTLHTVRLGLLKKVVERFSEKLVEWSDGDRDAPRRHAERVAQVAPFNDGLEVFRAWASGSVLDKRKPSPSWTPSPASWPSAASCPSSRRPPP